MRFIASAKTLATETTCILDIFFPSGRAIVSVKIILSIGALSNLSIAGPDKTPWVATAITDANGNYTLNPADNKGVRVVADGGTDSYTGETITISLSASKSSYSKYFFWYSINFFGEVR